MLNKLRTFAHSTSFVGWTLLLMTVFSFLAFSYKNKIQTSCYQGLVPIETSVRDVQYYLSKAYIKLERGLTDDSIKSSGSVLGFIHKAQEGARKGLEASSRQWNPAGKPGDSGSNQIYDRFIQLQATLQLFEETANRLIKGPEMSAGRLGRAQQQYYFEADQTLGIISEFLRKERGRVDFRRSTIEIVFNTGWVIFSAGVVLFAIRIERTGTQYRKKLRLNEARLRGLLEAFPDPVLIVDHAGVIRELYSPNTNLLPCFSDNLVGRGIVSLVGEANEKLAIDHIQEALAKTHVVVFDYVQEINKETCYFSGRLMAVPGAASPHVLWVVHDMTDIRQTQEQRLILERRIQENLRQESLGRMAEGIAHDFDNLLTGVIGHAEVALQEIDKNSPMAQYLKEIARAASKAADLASQMLKYSGNKHLAFDEVNLNDLVHDMDVELRKNLPKAVKLTTVYSDDPPIFTGDADQIMQALRNVIQNAFEAMSDQAGQVRLYTGRGRFSASELKDNYFKEDFPPGDYAFFRVVDTGCGISPDDYERLFDPFFTTKFTGRGLGLAVTQGILRGHRGVIRVGSEQGNGATFELLFPCERQVSTDEESHFSGVLQSTG